MNNLSSLPDSVPDTRLRIGNLAAALAAAQAKMAGAKRDSSNPFYKSKYADLASVWEACRAALSEQKLAVIQTTDCGGPNGEITLVTTLAHESGEYVRGFYPIQPAKDRDPQALGSALTYARRYALAAIVGVAPEDDDGEAAMNRSAPANSAPKAKPTIDSLAKASSPSANAAPPAKAEKVWSKTWQANPQHALETRIPVSLPMWNLWADSPTGLGVFVDKGHDTWRKVSRGSLNGYRHKMLLQAVEYAEANPTEATEYHERAACTLAVMLWLNAKAETEPTRDDTPREQDHTPGLFKGARQ